MQRCCAQNIKKPGVEFLQFVKITLEIERNGVDFFLEGRRNLRGHWVAALETVQVPLCFDPQMSHDDVDAIALRKRSPVDLVVAQIVDSLLQETPNALIHFANDPQSIVHGYPLLDARPCLLMSVLSRIRYYGAGPIQHNNPPVLKMALIFAKISTKMNPRPILLFAALLSIGLAVAQPSSFDWKQIEQLRKDEKLEEALNLVLDWKKQNRLPLRADLVTLSACQSALGSLITGEGMVGLTQSFFYAGTQSILASLWNVNDEASARFMTAKAEALRQARLEMKNDHRYRHPYFGAPYILIGRGDDSVRFPKDWTPLWVLLGLAVTGGAIILLRRRVNSRACTPTRRIA